METHSILQAVTFWVVAAGTLVSASLLGWAINAYLRRRNVALKSQLDKKRVK